MLGMILTLIYENDGSIISPIVFHSSFNIIMIAFILI
jgi:membrane protease YdiL (CAAX protease family)